MTKKHNFLLACTSLLLVPLALSGCGKQTKKVHHTPKMTYTNIVGGNQDYYETAHSTQKLQEDLNKKGNHHKVIFLSTSLNGQTNGSTQDRMQEQHAQLEQKLAKSQQKPKLQNSSVINGNTKKTQQKAKIAQNKQWQKQQKESKQLKQEINQQQKQNSQQLQKLTQPTTIYIPSNTTIVGAPNTQMQNINFQIQGKNVVIRNLAMQVPQTKDASKQSIIQLQDTNGVKLKNNTFTGISQKANQQNKKKKAQQVTQTNGTAISLEQAKHTVATKNQYQSLKQAINTNQGAANSSTNQLHFLDSSLSNVSTPFSLINTYAKIHRLDVQYHKGLSLLDISTPVNLDLSDLNVNAKGESANQAAQQLLHMAKDTSPSFFSGQKIEINGKGYLFQFKNHKLIIKKIPTPYNRDVSKDVGNTLSEHEALN